MKTFSKTPLLLLGLGILSFSSCDTSAQEYSRNGLTVNAADLVSYQNIKIYPIRASASYVESNASLGVYGTLTESMEAGNLTIKEITGEHEGHDGSEQIIDQAQVNSLMAHNTSQDTIFVMAGEIVTGGKQDRVIAQDFLILPGEEKDLAVYCVEQGRWTPEGEAVSGDEETLYKFASAKSVASNSIRDKSEQSEVWRNVSYCFDMAGASSESDNYNDLKTDEDYVNAMLDYKIAMQEGLKDDDIVGFIAITGDQILACDIFHKNEQFDKLAPSLIEAFANDAYTIGEEPAVDFTAIGKQFEKACELLDSDAEQSENHKQLKNGKRTIHCASFD